MKKVYRILSLDISSSTIGWALFEYSRDGFALVEYGHMKPSKKIESKKLSERGAIFFPKMKEFLKKKAPDQIIVEDYVQSFTKGRSSARTIIVCSFYNELVSMIAKLELGISTTSYPVTTLRKIIGNEIGKQIQGKEDVFNAVIDNFASFILKKNLLNDNIRKESYDEADAIAVGWCHIILERKKKWED